MYFKNWVKSGGQYLFLLTLTAIIFAGCSQNKTTRWYSNFVILTFILADETSINVFTDLNVHNHWFGEFNTILEQ